MGKACHKAESTSSHLQPLDQSVQLLELVLVAAALQYDHWRPCRETVTSVPLVPEMLYTL